METTDRISPILNGDSALGDEHKAALWDIFHTTKDPQELAQRLSDVPVSPTTKNQLLNAKTEAGKPQGPSGVRDIVAQMASIDPDALEIAESHPNVLKTLVSAMAAQTEVKAPAATDDEKKKNQKPKPVIAPRLDGSAHLPAIPEGHYRIRASDGAIHDLPQENIGKAQEIDPQLHILNP